MSTHQTASLSFEEARGLLLLGLAVLILWAAWPTSLWLALVLVAATALFAGARRLARVPETSARGRIKAETAFVLAKLGRAGVFVAIGIACVCALQIALPFLQIVSNETLWEVEEFLSEARAHLHHLVGFEAFAIGLVVVVAVNLLVPQAPLLPHFATVKSALVSLYFILIGITSFTFFSVLSVQSQEQRWVEGLRATARPLLEERAELSRETIAAAWTEQTVKTLDKTQKNALAPYFRQHNDVPVPAVRVRQLAVRLADAAPRLEDKPAPAASEPQKAAYETQDYLTRQQATTAESPTLKQAEQALEPLRRDAERAKILRKAAVELVAEAFGDVLGGAADRHLTQAFVEELVSGVAKRSLGRVAPSVESIDQARAWISTTIGGAHPAEAKSAGLAWIWTQATIEPKTAHAIDPWLARPPRGPLDLDLGLPKSGEGLEARIPRSPTFEPKPAPFELPKPPAFEVPRFRVPLRW